METNKKTIEKGAPKYTIWDGGIDLMEYGQELKKMSDHGVELQKAKPDECENLTEDELYQLASETLYDDLEIERTNLDIELPGQIIVIGRLGLWFGTRQGYKLLHSSNVKDILYSLCRGESTCHYFSDGYDICATEAHHDGTNFYTYRYIRPDVDIDPFLNLVASGAPIASSIMKKYTGSLVPYVHPVYGWDIPTDSEQKTA